jgi:uncharacterized membrane protein
MPEFSLENLVLIIGGTLTGLIAGVYYTFNVAIVPALRAANPTHHIAVMQAINDKIKNPVFFLSFLGPTVLLPLAAYLHRDRPEFWLIAAAAALHIVGGNGVTIAGNIPLNERLARLDVRQLSEAEAERVRTEFQGVGSAWMRLHHLRTLTSALAVALLLIACLVKYAPR